MAGGLICGARHSDASECDTSLVYIKIYSVSAVLPDPVNQHHILVMLQLSLVRKDKVLTLGSWIAVVNELCGGNKSSSHVDVLGIKIRRRPAASTTSLSPSLSF